MQRRRIFLTAVLATVLCLCIPVANAFERSTHLLSAGDKLRTASTFESNRVCVIVRTYWGHGDAQSGSLQRLLGSLQRQRHDRWEALLVILDNVPFAELDVMLRRLHDDRIWTYANWRAVAQIHPDNAPKAKDGTWNPLYHNKLYNLTDEAVRACRPDTEWVVFTNGDNEYHDEAFASLTAASGDVVAWDMYSRYQRPTGIPCERFQAGEGAPACKVNRMRWCHTDLGAVAYRWPRFVQDDMRFGVLHQNGRFTGQDGLMAELVVKRKWPLHHEEGRCLFDQGPNPQMCARNGGVWDERTANTAHDFGGHCITQDEAAAAMTDTAVAAVDIDLSHDGALAGLSGSSAPVTHITCLRPAENYKYMLIPPFGVGCMDPADADLMEEYKTTEHSKVRAGRLGETHKCDVNAEANAFTAFSYTLGILVQDATTAAVREPHTRTTAKQAAPTAASAAGSVNSKTPTTKPEHDELR